VAVPVAAGLLVILGLAPALLLALAALTALPLIVLLWSWGNGGRDAIELSVAGGGATVTAAASATSADALVGGARRIVRVLLTTTTVVTFAISSFAVQIPAIVGRYGALTTGAAFGAFGLGFLLGGFVLRVLRRASEATVCGTGLVVMALGDLLFAWLSGSVVGIAGLLVAGMGMLPTRVGLRTLVQTAVSKEQLGSVASAQAGLALAARPASLAFAGGVMVVADPRLAVVAFALVLVASAWFIIIGTRRATNVAQTGELPGVRSPAG
jgi:hypothetical protein